MEKENKSDIGVIQAGSEQGEKLNQLYQLDYNMRGAYIVQTNWIESFLNEGLANHFFPEDENRKNQFFSTILKEINFSTRINLYVNVVEEYYSQANLKTTILRKNLEKIRDNRNKFAHAVIDTSDEFLKKYSGDRIKLEFFKKGKKEHLELTMEEMKTLLGDTTAVTLMILETNSYIKQNSK